MEESLEKKYRQSTISHDELQRLREEVGQKTDAEIASAMDAAWATTGDGAGVPQAVVDRIHDRVMAEVGAVPVRKPNLRVWKFLLAAAAAVILLLCVSTVYLYRDNTKMMDLPMAVSTATGERIQLSLPDGTKVWLNENSNLSYYPAAFTKGQRDVHFDGEGYFEVAKDAEHPFSIDAQVLDVTVLGTKFNLYYRKQAPTATVTLKEGSVKLLSVKSQENVILQPDQMATLNLSTGKFSIIRIDGKNIGAWKSKVLTFRNDNLGTVLNAIENIYHVNITPEDEVNMADSFTGIMPANDLATCLRILKASYGVAFQVTE